MYHKRDLDKDEVIKLYVDEDLLPCQIGEKLNCSPDSISAALRRWQIPCRGRSESMRRVRLMERTHNGKNGRHLSVRGYWMLYRPGHKRASKNYVYEHIVIWEEANKQDLPDGWIIHHINGITTDNRPKNLFACSSKEHRHIIPKLQQRIQELERLHCKEAVI